MKFEVDTEIPLCEIIIPVVHLCTFDDFSMQQMAQMSFRPRLGLVCQKKSTTFPKKGGTAYVYIYIFKYNHIYHISSSRIKKHIYVTFLSLTPQIFSSPKFTRFSTSGWWPVRPVDVDKHWQENAAVLEARPLRFGRWSKNPGPIWSGFFSGQKNRTPQTKVFAEFAMWIVYIYLRFHTVL